MENRSYSSRRAQPVNYAESSDDEDVQELYGHDEYNYDDGWSSVDEDEIVEIERTTQVQYRSAASTVQPYEVLQPISDSELTIHIMIPSLPTNFLVPIDDLFNPILVYEKLFEQSINDIYEYNRDRYQEHIIEKIRSSTSTRFTTIYQPLTLADIYAFIGAIYIMDIYRFPKLDMYWGYSGSILEINQISKSISLNKFIHIRQCIGMPHQDKLFQSICRASSDIIQRSPQLAIDEQLKLFKGRYVNKVTIDKKPAGTGVKSYLVGDSNTKLPIWYSIDGKGESNETINNMGQYASVAASMVTCYSNSQLFVDNLYTTLELLKYCQSKSIEVVGTVRYNNLPKSLKPLYLEFKKLKQNRAQGYRDSKPIVELISKSYKIDNCFYTFVKDNGCFCIATNSQTIYQKGKYISLCKLTVDQRKAFKVEEFEIYKLVPYSVGLYNQKMNAIDIIDQLISAHERHQRQSKWTLAYMYTAIRMAETAAFTIFRL